MRLRLTLVLTLAITSAAVAQSTPFTLNTQQPVFQSGALMTWSIEGQPGQPGLLLADLVPGPTPIPGLGTFQVGFSPAFAAMPFALGPSGVLTVCDGAPCPPRGVTETAGYLQAVSIDPTTLTLLLSNGIALRAQDPAGFCAPSVCAAPGSIGSNFNGTAIEEGKYVWFNAIVKLKDLDNRPATVRFRNVRVTLDVNGTLMEVTAPRSTIIVSPLVATPDTFFDRGWRTSVPVGTSDNVFLSGVTLQVPAGGFPGGISPVTWSGDFSSTVPNVSFQWKWAAAVYCDFTSDYGALGVAPVDGRDKAGTPANFKNAVTGGARGGGGSNFTGSYSGTRTAACR